MTALGQEAIAELVERIAARLDTDVVVTDADDDTLDLLIEYQFLLAPGLGSCHLWWQPAHGRSAWHVPGWSWDGDPDQLLVGADGKPLGPDAGVDQVVEAVAWTTVVARWGDPDEWDELDDTWTASLVTELAARGITVTDTYETWIGILDVDGWEWGLAWPGGRRDSLAYGWVEPGVDGLTHPQRLGTVLDPRGVAALVAGVIPKERDH